MEGGRRRFAFSSWVAGPPPRRVSVTEHVRFLPRSEDDVSGMPGCPQVSRRKQLCRRGGCACLCWPTRSKPRGKRGIKEEVKKMSWHLKDELLSCNARFRGSSPLPQTREKETGHASECKIRPFFLFQYGSNNNKSPQSMLLKHCSIVLKALLVLFLIY